MTVRRNQIADQLRQRLLSGLQLGTLAHGARLPSLRDLAAEFRVDPRVVMAAYRELEKEELVEVRPRSGIFVAAADPTESQLQRRTADWMVNVLMDGLGRGIAAPEFPERLRQTLETRRLRAACIECNHDQIASLAEELHLDYGMDASGVDTFTLLSGPEPPLDVQRADLLVTTPFHIIEVEPVAKSLGKPWIIVELRIDLFADIARRLLKGPVYFVVTDPRFAYKLGEIYKGSAGADNLHVLIVGRDDIARIPEDSLTYVTRLARDRLGQKDLPSGFIPEMRAFARETSRQIFSFIVRANLAALTRQAS